MSALSELVREWLMSLAIRGMRLADELHTAPDAEVNWRDHLAWWIDGKLMSLFAAVHQGSRSELDAVWRGEIPPAYMNVRQRALLPGERSYVWCACVQPGCWWQGGLDKTLGYFDREEFLDDEDFDCGDLPEVDEGDGYCPRCGHLVWLEGLLRDEPQLALPAPGERNAA